METKLFEIRDRMTFIPVICIKCDPTNEAERYLLAMAGYGLQVEEIRENILYAKLAEGAMLSGDPHEHWKQPRTHTAAHQYIIQSWEELKTGDVVDIEFILQETTEPKKSQRLQ